MLGIEIKKKILTKNVMHQSFVTTAPPPMGKGGDNLTFQFSMPCYKPLGGKLEVTTLLFAPPLTIENIPGLRILMSKPQYFPCTAGTLEK